jgi:hypothetical protein
MKLDFIHESIGRMKVLCKHCLLAVTLQIILEPGMDWWRNLPFRRIFDAHFLETNDHGVDVPGLQALAEALRPTDRWSILAPIRSTQNQTPLIKTRPAVGNVSASPVVSTVGIVDASITSYKGSTRTADTLYSGILAMGSMLVGVRMLAAASA